MNELKGCGDTPSELCISVRLRVTNEKRRESFFFCVSHSKVGVIEGQGVFQQTGSRPLKLQVRQEGQLNTSYHPLLSEINMKKMYNKCLKMSDWLKGD